MPPRISAQALVARAEQRITTLSPRQVAERLEEPGVLLVDIRGRRERKCEGFIPGAKKRAPCGMLVFWVDPDLPARR